MKLFSVCLLATVAGICHAWLPVSHVSTTRTRHSSSQGRQWHYHNSRHSSSARQLRAGKLKTAEKKSTIQSNTTSFAWGTNVKSSPNQKDVSFFFPWSNGKIDDAQPPVPSQLHESMENETIISPELLAAGAFVGLIATVASTYTTNQFDLSSFQIVEGIQGIFQNPSATLDQVVQMVESMGPIGALYFGIAYTIAEVLAIPAIPLTASAGYLFGPVEGTTVVLLSASAAASISFVIGRTLLRDYVERALDEYPKFRKLDRAIGKEGFKLMLVLRLSPIFPFALSNYLYGASSINFNAFFWGTLFGFAPGTIAYVCTGAFGKALQMGGESNYPWYIYGGGLTILAGFIKLLADAAARVVEEMEEEEDSMS